MRRRFATLDVFTDRCFSGNPLAVVLEPHGLDTAAMQAIAREFNHPETVFVQAPSDRAHRARLRIFTPARELPFAGHPTVGTAVLLGLDGSPAVRELVLEEGIGNVHCLVEPTGEGQGRARFALPQMPAPMSGMPDDAAIVAALGLTSADLGFAGFRPARWSAGLPISFVPVRGLAAVGGCRPDAQRLSQAFGDSAVYLFCGESAEPGHSYHARMFAPALGVPEDPATGSAAAAFAGMLATAGGLGDGEHAIAIEQGYEMGRPSVLRLTITLRAGQLRSAAVGGDAVLVTEGTIEA